MNDTDQNLKDSLLQEGGLERYIQSGRVPRFNVGTPLVFVPPIGTQFGDHFVRHNYMEAILQGQNPKGMGDSGTIEFFFSRWSVSRIGNNRSSNRRRI